MPDVVAVQQVSHLTGFDQRTFHRDRERGLAGGRKPGEPDRGAALTGGRPAVAAVQR